ncbi:hypothetical protein EKL97_09035 [Flavobacterium sp. LS1P28]|nr:MULTISPECIES: hypothetical protein [unclassified Flavobacterium]RTY64113.1 hypothetical protein EKL95_14725 [Flavobacterium sp. LB2P53]RTY75925.1 hypothetical protein EKL96_00045 [Flavobacterium sp. LS1R10]RTY80886.1 hypothetical protein EKL97_09035 [Flavobacterium sp. LS1P28]RTZ01554.1 hypothetical protein EKM02_06025 [Flavobacterium sp. RSP49]RTY82856.1 hypothetical protein EKL99_09185 [Flavobacterium sp. ZB4P23]
MLKSIRINIQKKSLKERFLLVLGIMFFLVYLVLGLFIIFMKEFPIVMDTGYRIAFGLLLIVYSFFRFIRLINNTN